VWPSQPEERRFRLHGPLWPPELCLRHFDEEHDVCQQCAAQTIRSTRRQLEDRLSSLRAEARAQLEEGNLTQALLACGRALDLAPEDEEALRLLQACEDHLRRLQAEAERGREAQARLAQIEERERAAEEARQQAEEAAARAPIWQQIGMEMVTISAGEFLYGEKTERAHLPEVRLARTPVTNSQYKAFVEATGHDRPRHWEGGQIPPCKGDHPVVNVNWHDAQAFCQWAGCCLPTELEWEKGARGTDGRDYPWGDGWQLGRCNTAEAGIGDTTSVTKYANGASPYGLLDMAGNVLEWCEGWYDSDRGTKVLRGGTWNYFRLRAPCAYRYGRYPGNRHEKNCGFRCCVGSTLPP